MSTFCTAVNCMDGRIQLPVIDYLMKSRGFDHVDAITELGPVRLFSQVAFSPELTSIHARIRVSLGLHGSRVIALVAHADCAGNPLGKDAQLRQLELGVRELAIRYPQAEVMGLWVGDDWRVEDTGLGGGGASSRELHR